MAAGRTAWWLRLYRAAVFVVVILMIHRGAPPVDPDTAMGVSVADLKEFFPAAVGVSGRVSEDGAHFVLDASRNELGFVVATSPDSDHIIGYSGPNNVLVAFGADGKVLGIRVLDSGDTPEHLEDVLEDEAFMGSFDGKTWEELQATREVDGVSGATLTSLAIAEGIIQRVSGDAPSLRFPRPLELADAKRLFPEAAELEPDGDVLGADGGVIGRLLRTSPHSDNVVGYGGPSDVLVGVKGDRDEIIGIAIRDTYDTAKYVGWVTDEAYFMELFNGKPLAELAGFDLQANEVEGVSGATMTSMAVAQSLVELANSEVAISATATGSYESFAIYEIGSRGFGTALVVVFGLVMAFTKLRGVRKLRIAFQLVLIVYLGLINGDLISQAILAGWAENGLAWRFAPGMLLLVSAALLVPLFTRKQVYCHQLCPHGAAQQLLRNVLPKRMKFGVPPRIERVLRAIPFLLILFVIVVAVLQLGFNLASIEPFDAYVWRVAGVATITIAIVGLIASLFVPMAYCHFGCPTGAMLNFLWGGGRPGKFSRRDGLALVCVVLAVGLRISNL